MKVAYFQPVVIAVDNVPPVEFSKIFNLTENIHGHPELNDPTGALVNIRGGQHIQVYPNKLELDVSWLVKWLETACQGYMELIAQQSGTEDLRMCKPVIASIWTTKQGPGDYQEMHTHPVGNISGNIYVSAPQLNDGSDPSDGQTLFRLPQVRDVTRFMMSDTWKYTPEPGTIVVFPSHLPHTVYPWDGVGYRTVVSFDARLVPRDE